MALSDLNVRLGLITKSFDAQMRKTERNLARFQRNVGNIGQNLTQSITLPLIGLGAAAIKNFSNIERQSKALEVALGGNAELARVELEKLRKVAQNPGLDFEQAIKGSVRLQAVGFSAEQARRTIGAFSNALALAGGTAVDLDGVTLALTQIASKGKVSAEEINQIAERVPQIRKIMVDTFGTTRGDDIEKLGVSAADFVAQITTAFEKLPRAQNTFSNSFENLAQSVRISLSRIGEEISKAFNLNQVFNNLAKRIESISEAFSNLDDSTKRNIIRFAAFATALGPTLIIISKLSSLVSVAASGFGLLVKAANVVPAVLIAISNPATVLSGSFALLTKGLTSIKVALSAINPLFIAAGAAIAVAVSAYRGYTRQVELTQQVQNTIPEVNRKANQSIAAQKVALDKIKTSLDNSNDSLENRRAAIAELQKIHPGYFSDLKAEKTNVDEIKAALDKYLIAIQKRAQLIAAQDKLVEIEKQLLDVQERQAKAAPTLAQTTANLAKSFSLYGASSKFAFEQGKSAAKNFAAETDALLKQRDALTSLIAEREKDNDERLDTNTASKTFNKSNIKANELLKKASEILKEYRENIQEVSTETRLFGATVGEDLQKKLEITKSAILDSIQVLGENSQVVKTLRKEYAKLLNLKFDSLPDDPLAPVQDIRPGILAGSVNDAPDNIFPDLSAFTESEVALAKYNLRLIRASEQASALGTTAGDLLKEKLGITAAAIASATEDLGVNSEAVKTLKTEYEDLKESLADEETFSSIIEEAGLKINELGKGVINFQEIAKQGIQLFGQSFADAISGVKSFADAFKEATATIVGLLVKQGVAAAISNTLKSPTGFLGPLAIPIAAAAGIAAKSLFSRVVGLEKGGIIPPGFPNDTFPAFLSSGEAVIPLDRLSGLVGDSGTTFIANTRLSGEDIVISYEKAKQRMIR